MGEPNPMRFYCNGTTAEPVGPKASARLHGRLRRSYSLAEAEKETRWPALALVALHEATYPPKGSRDDPRLGEFAEAMFDPEVYEPLLFFVDRIGTLPASTFLRALLIQWDMADDHENKRDTIIEAIGANLSGPSLTRSWFTSEAAAARVGKGADHG